MDKHSSLFFGNIFNTEKGLFDRPQTDSSLVVDLKKKWKIVWKSEEGSKGCFSIISFSILQFFIFFFFLKVNEKSLSVKFTVVSLESDSKLLKSAYFMDILWLFTHTLAYFTYILA